MHEKEKTALTGTLLKSSQEEMKRTEIGGQLPLELFLCQQFLLGNGCTIFPFLQQEQCTPGLRDGSEKVQTTMGLSPIQVPACSLGILVWSSSPLILPDVLPTMGEIQARCYFASQGSHYDSAELQAFRTPFQLLRILSPGTQSKSNFY